MKKGIITFLLTLLVNLIFAQHTLLSNEMLGFGSVMTHKYINDISVVDTTIQGNGVVWNFSSITNDISNYDLIVTIASPNSTPYAINFPNATYAYKEESNGTTNYRFFNLSPNKMERVGSYVSSINTYSDPQIEYIFPLTLGTTNNDSWISTNSSFGGTYDLECIGSGTLITPGGTFDALMVRVHMVEFLDIYAYFWYSADNGSPLLTYIVGDGFFTNSYGMYINELNATGVKDIEFIKEISYNNPIDDILKINFKPTATTNCSFAVINSMGNIVYQETSYIINGNKESLNINFSDYPAGIYFLRFTSDKGIKTCKVIKK